MRYNQASIKEEKELINYDETIPIDIILENGTTVIINVSIKDNPKKVAVNFCKNHKANPNIIEKLIRKKLPSHNSNIESNNNDQYNKVINNNNIEMEFV